MTRPIVDLYAICWNDADMLGFFFRHYDPWIDRYVIFDDGSTDGSLELLRDHPRVELRRFERTDPKSFVASQQALQNQVWQESRGRADFAVVTAIDELLWVPGREMAAVIADYAAAGVTLAPALGYMMISDEFPEPEEELPRTRTRGAPWALMNKLSLISPEAIEETHFDPGRHTAAPTGRLRWPDRDELLLLHYKFLDPQRLLERNAELRSRRGETDVDRGWGHAWEDRTTREDWERAAAAAVDVSAPGHDAHDTHAEPRWWRSTPEQAAEERNRLRASLEKSQADRRALRDTIVIKNRDRRRIVELLAAKERDLRTLGEQNEAQREEIAELRRQLERLTSDRDRDAEKLRKARPPAS